MTVDLKQPFQFRSRNLSVTMPHTSDEYRIHHYGGKTAVSHDAAVAALPLVVKYVARTEGVEITEQDVNVVSGTIPGEREWSVDDLLGLIKLVKPKWFFVTPMANSVVGDVPDFMPFHQFHLVESLDVDINWVICNQSGNPQDIRLFVTKDTAFKQVASDLVERGFNIEKLDGSNDKDTSAGVELAKRDSTIAAICTIDACIEAGLHQVGEVIKRKTLFSIFVNESRTKERAGDYHYQYLAFTKHADLYFEDGAGGDQVKFAERVSRTGTDKLTVKWGIDPISNKMHLGHLACLYRLREFLQFGHKVVIVLGTFTGEIGDPSGNLTARPRYDRSTLKASALMLERQIRVVLAEFAGEGDGLLEIQRNHEWIEDMDMSQLLRWGYDIDQSLLFDRLDFKTRLKNNRRLSLSELLYGLFQTYDTFVKAPDIEFAGWDQLHNGVLMRSIFLLERRPLPFLMLMPLLHGTKADGKMSSFSKNDVGITLDRETIRARLQSITSVNVIKQYFQLLTDEPDEKVYAECDAVKNGGLELCDLQSMLAEAVLDKLPKGLENLPEKSEA